MRKIFLSIPKTEIEYGALNQIDAVLKLDCLKALAVMPDVHQGYDLPIGGVALLDEHISPSFVGYDIGCGMSHVNTGVVIDKGGKDYESWGKHVFESVYAKIPVGFNTHEKKTKATGILSEFRSASGDKELDKSVNKIMLMQLGTLGGGNHFIEFGLNSKNELGVTIHSGSRKTGHTVCSFYTRGKGGVIFEANSEMGNAYVNDMDFCLEYALENRKRMMEFILRDILDISVPMSKLGFVNKNHNHAIKTPDGWLHRKGAISAAKGEPGIIPGNMRDGVYITEGLGNDEWLNSASHGAGRKMSRAAADKSFTMEEFAKQMNGITARVTEATLDESPMAYKDLVAVIRAQEGKTIRVVDRFAPIINIKAEDKNAWRRKK